MTLQRHQATRGSHLESSRSPKRELRRHYRRNRIHGCSFARIADTALLSGFCLMWVRGVVRRGPKVRSRVQGSSGTHFEYCCGRKLKDENLTARNRSVPRESRNARRMSKGIDVYDDEVKELLRVDGGTPDDQQDELIEALKQAAIDEIVGSLTKEESPPTSISSLHAKRLKLICDRMKRSLSAREIAVIFRISTKKAVRLHDQMESTYPRQAQAWQEKVVARSFRDIGLPTSTTGPAAHLSVSFDSREGALAAEKIIERSGHSALANFRAGGFKIVVPIHDGNSDEAFAVIKDTLGLKKEVEAAQESLAAREEAEAKEETARRLMKKKKGKS